MNLKWFSQPEPVVEEALDSDLAALAEIHAASFTHGWDADELATLRDQSGAFLLIARRPHPKGKREPLGFVLMREVAGEAEVLTLAVSPRHRRHGLAARLMRDGMFRLYGNRCEALFLEVDAANDAAVALYRSLGFLQVGERKGYYRSPVSGEGTALVMKRTIG